MSFSKELEHSALEYAKAMFDRIGSRDPEEIVSHIIEFYQKEIVSFMLDYDDDWKSIVLAKLKGDDLDRMTIPVDSNPFKHVMRRILVYSFVNDVLDLRHEAEEWLENQDEDEVEQARRMV